MAYGTARAHNGVRQCGRTAMRWYVRVAALVTASRAYAANGPIVELTALEGILSNVFWVLVLLSLVGLCGAGVFRQWRVAGRMPFGRWVLHNFLIDISAGFWVVLVIVFVLGLSALLVGMLADLGGLSAVGPGWPY